MSTVWQAVCTKCGWHTIFRWKNTKARCRRCGHDELDFTAEHWA